MVIAVFRFIVWAMLALWVSIPLGDFPNQILAAPVNHNHALALGVTDERTQKLNGSDAGATIAGPTL